MTKFVRNTPRGRPPSAVNRELELQAIEKHLATGEITQCPTRCVVKTRLRLTAAEQRAKLARLEITPGVFNAARAAIQKFR